jgi:hypothetical protein
MFKHNWNKEYIMVNPSDRLIIANKCNNEEMISETKPGKKQKWWKLKHNPNGVIPTNIYLLGKGTIQQLHNEYNKKYDYIEWSDFIDYTRELIKQGIII